MFTYLLIVVLLLVLELAYFKIADKYNIIDKPNLRSSHTSIVLRGGGIIFLFGAWLYVAFYGFTCLWFLLGLTMLGGISTQQISSDCAVYRYGTYVLPMGYFVA